MITEEAPLISCIMPTRNRSAFVTQAVSYFKAQDYPNKELIIVSDGDESIVLPEEEEAAIRVITVSEACSIGMKRNLAISLAQGTIICHFDDDDYYGPHRLSQQVAPLLRGDAEISGLRMFFLLDVQENALWTCSDDTHRRCFKQDIHYGTLMYNASYWHNGTHFASVNCGEDVRFVHALLAQNARLARVVDPASYIYVLHGGNTTSDMRLVHADGWHRVALEQYLSEEQRAFYAALREKRRVNPDVSLEEGIKRARSASYSTAKAR